MLISLLTFISVEILYNKSNKKYGGNDMSIVQLYDITQINRSLNIRIMNQHHTYINFLNSTMK